MASRLIGVMGKKRHGKDTFARRLVEEHGYRRFAFADALRDAALGLDPMISTLLDGSPIRLSEHVSAVGWERAKETPEVRRTLQNFGVGIRDLDPDFWVRVVMRQVDEHAGPAVITDVRFPNEADAVRAASGVLVRVVNPRVTSSDSHVSETALDHYAPNVTVPNAGTIETLQHDADILAERLDRYGY